MEPENTSSDDELAPFREPIALPRVLSAEEEALYRKQIPAPARLFSAMRRVFGGSSSSTKAESSPEQGLSMSPLSRPPASPRPARRANSSSSSVEVMNLNSDLEGGGNTDALDAVEATRTEFKYRASRRSNAVLCVLASFLICCIISFVAVIYINLLPGGANAGGEQLMNPYLADGKLTVAYMNRKLDPCEDFVGYSMQKWIDAANATSNNTGRRSFSFDTVRSRVEQAIGEILEQDWPYLGPFYSSCMQLPELRTDRFLSISAWALRLSSISERGQLLKYAAKLRNETGFDLQLLFALSVQIDPGEPSRYAYSLTANGFLMPSKQHYNSTKSLAFYRGWIQRVFQFIGFSIGDARIDALIEFEREAATLGMTPDELHDPLLTANYFPPEEIPALLGPSAYSYVQELLPRVNSSGARFVVDDVLYFKTLALPSIEVLRDTALIRLLMQALPLLDQQGQQLVNNYTQYFGGSPMTHTDYCRQLSEDQLGWLISRYYVAAVYEESDKSRVAAVWALLRDKLQALVGEWSWLDDSSRAGALAKYETLDVLAAYPERWPDYDAMFLAANLLPLRRDSLVDNVVKLNRLYDSQLLNRIGQPVDRFDWLMTPVTVNAYYEPSTNTIVLPLAIEQEPFLSSAQPYAGNLAMFWAVVMHEAFHAIDSSGALYDSTGRLTEWMTFYSRSIFNSRVACIEEQFSEYTVLSSLNHLNGKLVSGEAMADLNGLKLCYSLLAEFALTRNATWDQEVKWIEDAYDGLTMEQLFFVKYAQLWASVVAPALALERSRTDPHAPPDLRVLGTLSNMESFANAFQCRSGSAYNPRLKCSME